MSRSSWPRTSPSSRSTAAAFPVTICSHRAGSPPATRVTSRTPCPESARCSGGASASRPATSTASRCGTWEIRATATSCSSGAISSGVAPHSRARARTVSTAAGPGAGVRRDRPRAAVEQRRGRGERAGPFGARHRVRPDVPLQAGRLGDHAERRALDAAHIGDDGVGEPRQRGPDLLPEQGGGHRDDDEPRTGRGGGRRGRRRGDARTQPGGGADVLLVHVGQPHLDVVPAQGQADGGAEQAGTDDQHRAREGLTHRRGPTGHG